MAGFWNVAMLCSFLALCTVTRGDPAFIWKFGDNFFETAFSECQKLPVKVVPSNSSSTFTGVGPYYLFAFEVGGISSSSMIGTDPGNLSWQNTHKQGASLMITVVDSAQNVGGFTGNLFDVMAGSDTSCLPTPSDSQIPPAIASITPNVTGRIETCDPWGLTVTGGKKPYHILLSALNSPVITNVSMGVNDDVVTFIDRADPGEPLMASVVDANGAFGISSPLIMPFGSTDVTCTGRVTTSKTAAELEQEKQDRETALALEQQKNNHTHLVVSLSIATGVTAFYALSVGLWWFVRRRVRRRQGTWGSNQDYRPRAWRISRNTVANTQYDSIIAPKLSRQPTYRPLEDPYMDATIPTVHFDRGQSQAQAESSMDAEASSSLPPTSVIQMTAQERKVLGVQSHQPPGASVLRGASASSSSSRSTSTPFVDETLNPDAQPDIIIQHRDGGAGVVLELPPPYADHTVRAPTSPRSPHSSSHTSRAHNVPLS